MPRTLFALRYYLIHTVAFSVFGAMCLLFIALLPINLLLLLGPREAFTKFNRYICRQAFRFVLWYTRKMNFLDVTFIDEAEGDYGNVIVANHVCMFDVVCLLAFFRNAGTYVNVKFLLNPLLTANILSSSYIPVRASLASKGSSMEKAMHQIRRGLPFIVFPEGTRTKDGTFGPFANGSFHLAVESRSDITPVFITIDRPFLNNTKMYRVSDGMVRLHIRILKKISIDPWDASRKSVVKLNARVVELLSEKAFSSDSLDWNRRLKA